MPLNKTEKITMVNFDWAVKLKDSPKAVERKIARTLASVVSERMRAIAPKLEERIKAVLRTTLESSPEVVALQPGNELHTQIGDPAAPRKMAEIIDHIVESVSIQITPARQYGPNALSAVRIVFDWNPGTIERIGVFKTEDGNVLPWAEWLTQLGDRIIVREYDVIHNRRRWSRTDDAIMVKVKAGGWNVPPEYSGTENDNFITRSIEAAMHTHLARIIKQEG